MAKFVDTQQSKKCGFSSNVANDTYYKLKPMKPLGAEVTGIDLSTSEMTSELIEKIRSDTHKYHLLIFRNQAPTTDNIIPPNKYVGIARKFGDIVSSHYNHPKSPNRDIFQVSNDSHIGCTNVGRTGWHIDGTFLNKPYSLSFMHIISVPKNGGETAFIAGDALISQLSSQQKSKWNRLFMIGRPPELPIHPLIYTHPISKRPASVIHLGMTQSFLELKNESNIETIDVSKELQLLLKNGGTENDKIRLLTRNETESMLQTIDSFITNDCRKNGLIYAHRYVKGDLVISDNLGVIHEAVPSTQYSVNQIGLRVMQRITIGGIFQPSKIPL